jgi:hypothetical protein
MWWAYTWGGGLYSGGLFLGGLYSGRGLYSEVYGKQIRDPLDTPPQNAFM